MPETRRPREQQKEEYVFEKMELDVPLGQGYVSLRHSF